MSFSLLEDMMMQQEGRYLTNEELSKMNNHTEMLVKCRINGMDCEVESYFDYKYFNCYRFKNDQITDDNTLVLTAVLYTGKPLWISPQHGFFVFIEDSTHYPLLSTPILLTPGLGRHIIVRRNSYDQCPMPYSACGVLDDNTLIESLFDRSIFDMVLATNYSYSRDICLKICNQVLNKQTCGCQTYDSYLLSGTKLCEENVVCTLENVSAFDYCMPRCPLECSQTVFRKTIHSYTYPTSYFNKYESVFIAANDYQPDDTDISQYMYDTFVEFSIRYDNALDAAYSEIPKMTTDDLLGVLGGHFHLFLGMSLLSFFEILELFVMFLVG